MKSIIGKIYSKNKENLVSDISNIYKEKKYLIINFIYFATFYRFILKNNNNITYKKALLNGDFLLPDGIALRTYLNKKFNIDTFNLNGTDFTPYFLKKFSDKNTHIAFYTVYDEKIGKKEDDVKIVKDYIKNNFEFKKINAFVSHYSKRGKDFDFNAYKSILNQEKFEKKIFLVGIGTPFQEEWAWEHIDFFKENGILVMNVGGLFDFWAGFEKRAPNFVRKINLEWLWRLVQNPKKNFNKVLDSFALFKELLKK